MPKVVLHNLTHPYNSFNPKVFNFDQQGVFFSEPGDIVMTREKISQDYLNFLEDIGFDFKNISFIWSDKELNNFDSIFQDEDLIGLIKSKLKNPRDYFLDVYIPGIKEKELAEKLGINFYHNPEHFHQWGAKSFFRKTARALGLPVAPGSEDIKNRSDFLLAGLKILKNGPQNLVIKQDGASAGMGSEILTPKDFFRTWRDFNIFKAELVKQGIGPVEDSSFILEKWFSGAQFSTCSYFEILKDGEIEFLNIIKQIQAPDSLRSKGALSWQFIPSEIREVIIEKSGLFAKWLSKNGYRGIFTLGTTCLEDGSLIWTDFNPRKGLSIYPYKIWQKVTGSNQSFYYKALSFKIEKFKGLDIGRVLNLFRNVLFLKHDGKGIIPYNYGLLESEGFLRVLFLAPKAEEMVELEERFTALTKG